VIFRSFGILFNRAGYAWSQDGPSPRTGRQISYELHKALHNAGIDGPYILVGQSFGGFLVRYFARFYRAEVAGMVLVDALNEDSRIVIDNQPFRIRDWAKGRQPPVPGDTTISNSNSTSEVVLDTTLEFPLNKLPAADQKLQIWAQSQRAHQQAGSSEMDWSPEDVADLYANKGKPDYVLGDMPLIVLSRGSEGYEGLPDSAALENERQYLQEDLTRLSTNSKHIIVTNCGHNIHLEQPGVVIDAIAQVIRAYRSHTKLEQ
jgi:pimeloyl-ACP methyl ester carboxylesterase